MSELHYLAGRKPQFWSNNPVLVQLLGLSPLLALSSSLAKGLALGLATAVVLVLGSLIISGCKRQIEGPWRFVFFVFVLAVFTTLVDILLRRYLFALHLELGIYIPLICCNLGLILHLETQAQQQTIGRSLGASLIVAGAYVFALCSFALIRELLIYGSIGHDWLLLVPTADARSAIASSTTADFFHFARFAPAAFILLGLLLGVKNWLTGNRPALEPETEITPAIRARVTGKIQSS